MLQVENEKLSHIEEKLKGIIINQLRLNLTNQEIDSTKENFLDSHGFNSVDALELLLLIEKEFNIEIDDEDLDASLFITIRGLAQYISNVQAINS